ncbi:citrate synthase/methylcitrate synthase [Halomarina litorea]|uniref:citrate synthase/methylcitrate synthase n=1 Tax=Halomarina litorea TaxID=2961595 RepID=UPI0020C42DC5|nr:citrate synthase/methylcitrate synthase [Halomarina sp. BCD28]
MADDTLDPGLEHVIAAETRLSHIDGEAGELVVAGYPLAELAGHATFEETVFLLRNDRLPTESELDALRDDLRAHRDVPEVTRELLREAAERGNGAMDAVRMGAASASLVRETDDPERDALLAVAQFPTIVGTYWRYRQGEDPLAPREDLGHAANYLYLLTGEVPDEARVRGLETYLNTVCDHGLNASTFAARAIVSTETDVLSAVTGAVGALKGPLHGGAPGPVLDMLREVHESGDAVTWVREALSSGQRLMGFGHRVYEVRDPRAAVLSTAAERLFEDRPDADLFETARETERVAVDLLEEHKPGRQLETNVEFYTAVLLCGVGVPQELFTATFGVARVAGWTAHCLEQLANNRIVRPRSRYVGERGRTWAALEAR